MACLPRPVMMRIWSHPEAMASSTPYWMMGLSTSGSISFGWALVAGKKRVPRPAAGNTALRTFMGMEASLVVSSLVVGCVTSVAGQLYLLGFGAGDPRRLKAAVGLAVDLWRGWKAAPLQSEPIQRFELLMQFPC